MKKFLSIFFLMVFVSQSLMAANAHHVVHKKNHVHKKSVHRVATKKVNTAKKRSKIAIKKTRHKKIVAHKKISIPNVRPASAVEPEQEQVVQAKPTYSFMASMKQHLVQYVQKTVSTLRYSAYKMGGTKFDVSRGIYVVDCSDYVDNILEEVYPNAFISLVNNTGADKPTTAHYYDFFNNLDNDSNKYWSKVNNVEDLQSGDVLVFRYRGAYNTSRGGHVMVVMDKPIADGDGYLVRVADSAPSGHSEDTRQGRVSGIGIGTLVLKSNPITGQPSAFAWKIGADWKSNVKIAMARPIDK